MCGGYWSSQKIASCKSCRHSSASWTVWRPTDFIWRCPNTVDQQRSPHGFTLDTQLNIFLTRMGRFPKTFYGLSNVCGHPPKVKYSRMHLLDHLFYAIHVVISTYRHNCLPEENRFHNLNSQFCLGFLFGLGGKQFFALGRPDCTNSQSQEERRSKTSESTSLNLINYLDMRKRRWCRPT